MSKVCNDCFAEIQECTCDPLNEEEKEVLTKFIDETEWIEVKSPFKAYPASEGV